MRSVLADMRSVAGVEQVAANVYSRTFEHGWLAARRDPKASQVVVDVCIDSIHAVRGLTIQMRRLFDLDCEPQTIETHLGSLAVARPGVRLQGAFHGFELAVRAVLGQQVTVKAATTLAQAVESEQLNLSQSASSQDSAELLIEQLCALPSFRPWTAHYIAMRVLG
jgi:3-methyladenine DNA glycosylase/8-oxoguanine DNA glycosylase